MAYIIHLSTSMPSISSIQVHEMKEGQMSDGSILLAPPQMGQGDWVP